MALQVCSPMYINELKLCMISFSVAPMDYDQNTPVILQFESCNMTQCHCIPIVDDDVFEGNEMFYVTLDFWTGTKLIRHMEPIEITEAEKCEYVSI